MRGLSLVNANDREWKINQLLFAGNVGLVADSEEKLCQLVEEFGRLFRRNLKVNDKRSKVMKCTRGCWW